MVLILTKVPRAQLITTGPNAIVRRPLYTGFALLVLPAIGVMLDSWLGSALGAVVCVGSRLYSPLEEQGVSRAFGAAWDDYLAKVGLPWL